MMCPTEAAPEVQCNIVSWKAARIRRVVNSTFSAELLSQTRMLDHVVWLKELLKEMTQQQLRTELRTDCFSLVENMQSLRIQVTEKRLTADMWALRNAYSQGEIQDFQHVPTKFMIADGLTKSKPDLKANIVKAMQGNLVVPWRT